MVSWFFIQQNSGNHFLNCQNYCINPTISLKNVRDGQLIIKILMWWGLKLEKVRWFIKLKHCIILKINVKNCEWFKIWLHLQVSKLTCHGLMYAGRTRCLLDQRQWVESLWFSFSGSIQSVKHFCLDSLNPISLRVIQRGPEDACTLSGLFYMRWILNLGNPNIL